MKATASIQLRQLLKERDKLAGELSGYKRIPRGTIVRRGNIRGTAVCVRKRKKNPVLHGPYPLSVPSLPEVYKHDIPEQEEAAR